MTRTAALSATSVAALALMALPGAAFAAVDPYHPNKIQCTVTPGTVTAGKPVTVAVLNTVPGQTVTVKGSGPVSVPTKAGKVGSAGGVNLSEGTGPGSGTGSFTVTVDNVSNHCHVTVKPLALQPTGVTRAPVLPFTGSSDLAPAVLGALALVGVGGGLVVAGRRRRTG